MNKIPLPPLFLHFCVRILCCQIFFVSVFISSKTPVIYADSAIFISGDAYIYADRQTYISVAAQADEKLANSTQSEYLQPKILKSSSKAAHTTARILGKRERPMHFTAPTDSQQLSSTGSFTLQAVMGTPSLRKLLRPMMSPALPQPHIMTLGKKKPLSSASYPCKVTQISTHQFGRPPPINDQSSLMKLNTDSTNIYAQMTQMF